MTYQPKHLAALTSAALLAGCASGGGSGGGTGGGQPYAPPPGDTPCGAAVCVPFRPEGFPTIAPDFRSWAELRRGTPTNTSVLSTTVSHDDAMQSVKTFGTGFGKALVEYDAQGRLVSMYPYMGTRGGDQTLAAIGHPGIDVSRHDPVPVYAPQTPFTSVSAGRFGVAANPYALGWNYQTFGVWNDHSREPTGYITPLSLGTGPSQLPTSGSATFTGKLAGMYISPTGQGSTAAADLSVNANFSTKTWTFASTGTVTTRDLVKSTPAPHLDLRGTLTVSPGAAFISGTLTNAGGTMSGQSAGRYYGPNGQELGGVFALRSATTVETFTGAYGAKR